MVGNEFDALHAEYSGRVSDMCLSLEATKYVIKLGEELKPTRILDTGSGWSSFFLKRCFPNAYVVSVDDSAKWLKTTEEYLRKNNIAVDELLTWESFSSQTWSGDRGFDLVVHDLGNRNTRAATLQFVLRTVRVGGAAYLDDVHKEDMRTKFVKTLNEMNLKYIDVKGETLDALGRYGWVVKV